MTGIDDNRTNEVSGLGRRAESRPDSCVNRVRNALRVSRTRFAAYSKKTDFLRWLDRATIALAIVGAVGLLWRVLAAQRKAPHWLELIHDAELVLTVLSAFLSFFFHLRRRIDTIAKSGIRAQIEEVVPYIWLRAKSDQKELSVLGHKLLALSTAFVRAVDTNTVDYNSEPLKLVFSDDSRHFAEFLYYWFLDSILCANAEKVCRLDMMHYVPCGEICPFFLRRFLRWQRRIPSDAFVRKVYRFRTKEDYDQSYFTKGHPLQWARQSLWSEFLLEEYGQNHEIRIGCGQEGTGWQEPPLLYEIADIRFREESKRAAGFVIKRLVAAAEKDNDSFEFRSGRISWETT